MNDIQLQNANNALQRHNVIEFEKLMQHGTKVEIKIDNYYSDGVYGRRAYIPAGTILTGHIHKFEQMNILLKGEIEIAGSGILKAPQVVVSPPGTKRLAKALTDCEWLTILRTDLCDADKIEAQFTCITEDEYQEFLAQQPALPFEAENVKRIS